jgi:hypothetical protein
MVFGHVKDVQEEYAAKGWLPPMSVRSYVVNRLFSRRLSSAERNCATASISSKKMTEGCRSRASVYSARSFSSDSPCH